jgi:hypothetical protein
MQSLPSPSAHDLSVASPASGEPYRLSLAPGRPQGTFDLRNVEDADEMILAINAWKALAKPRPKGDNEEK